MSDVSTRALEQSAILDGVAAPAAPEPRLSLRDYAVLLKPRVMSLVVFTALVGMLLAPAPLDPWRATLAIACIALGAGASGAINMWYDADIDVLMNRTRRRPIPSGRVAPRRALIYGSALSVVAVATMTWVANPAAGGLLAFTIAYYVFVYTMWLKRRTAQNIVIGGAAGAFPPMIGYIAATGHFGAQAGMLFAIIFLWTPPHSWALALFSNEDYARAGVPMMPVVAGPRRTKIQMAFYTALLLPATLAPVYLGMSGMLYAAGAVALGGGLVYHMARVWLDDTTAAARRMFFFTILYLFLIFVFLLVDRGVSLFF